MEVKDFNNLVMISKLVSNKFYLLIISTIALIIFCLGRYFSSYVPLPLDALINFDSEFSNQDRLMVFSLVFAVIGGLWVFLSYLKIKKREQNDFVKISLSATKIKQNVYIRTKVDNPVNINKQIKFAFLVISKTEKGVENSEFFKKIERLYKRKDIKITDDLIKLFEVSKMILNTIGLIPLPYYYKENIRVGNEELTHTYILTKEERNKMERGFYEVRFFVFSEEEHLHRSVQDAFFLYSTLTSKIKNTQQEKEEISYNDNSKKGNNNNNNNNPSDTKKNI